MSARRLCWLLVLPLSACKGDGGIEDRDLEDLVVAPPRPPPIDLDKAAADGLELGRALAAPHHELAPRLGSHTVRITSSYQVEEAGAVVDQLTDETVVEYAGDGAYHASYANSADYGREVLWHEGMMFLRPRYARWHRRPPTDEHEPAATRDQIYRVAGDYFDLVDHAAEVTDKGPIQLAGRDARKVELRLDPTPATPPAEALVQRKWRESVVVEELAGEAVLDRETAAPLQLRFDARLRFHRDGKTFTMAVGVAQEIGGIGQAVALAPPAPEEVVDTPERSRELDERDLLLDGMAPRKRKGGAGGQSRGSAIQ